MVKFNHSNFAAFGATQDTLEIFIYALDPSVIGVRITTKYTTAAGVPTSNIQVVSTTANPALAGTGVALAIVPVTDVISVGVTDVIIEPLVDSALGAMDIPQNGGN